MATAANQANNNRFWNFVNAGKEGDSGECVELRISGDILDDEDAWIYEWFGIPAASPNAFRQQLKNYAGQDITVWIDSYGGSVYAAAGIYNALKEHDGTITVKIDGKAMSAASVIAMAGDEIQMSPLSMMMIHDPLCSVYGYASDMRQVADVLDEIKNSIVNAYQLKTGLPRDKISSMMDDETYMSAKTAVREGFADGILYVDDKQDDVLNFSFSPSSFQSTASMPTAKLSELAALAEQSGATKPKNQPGAAAAKPPAVPDDNNNQEVTDSMEIKNAEDLKAQLPDVYNAAFNAGAAAEKARLQAFDALNGKVDPEYLAAEKAKPGATAESVALNAMREGKLINSAYMAQAAADAADVNKVPGDTSDDMKPDEVTGVLNKVANIVNRTFGKEGGNK